MLPPYGPLFTPVPSQTRRFAMQIEVSYELLLRERAQVLAHIREELRARAWLLARDIDPDAPLSIEIEMIKETDGKLAGNMPLTKYLNGVVRVDFGAYVREEPQR